MTSLEFSTQVQREMGVLRSYAVQLTRNIEDAHDLVQETLLKAFNYREKFADNTNLKGWLYTIMKNNFINNYRRMVKRKTFLDSTDDLYLLNAPLHVTHNSGESNFMMQDMQLAIEALPADLKEAWDLNYSGYKYHEIAELQQIPIGTVKTRIFMARKLLKKKLQNYGKSYGLKD